MSFECLDGQWVSLSFNKINIRAISLTIWAEDCCVVEAIRSIARIADLNLGRVLLYGCTEVLWERLLGGNEWNDCACSKHQRERVFHDADFVLFGERIRVECLTIKTVELFDRS